MLSKLTFGIFGPASTEPDQTSQLGKKKSEIDVKNFDQELQIECNHCKEMTSSHLIDEHE